MSLYCSTRNARHEGFTFLSLLPGNLASDGGLYVPLSFFQMSRAEVLLGRFLSYQELAFRVTRRFVGDISYPILRNLINVSFNDESFGTSPRSHLASGPVGLKLISHNSPLTYIAELSGGLSLSFKDIAMRMMGVLFSYSLSSRLTIVSATSGDTGSSACFALVGRNNCQLTILSPGEGLTNFQKEQLHGILSENILAISLDGKFDCCQNMLKGILCCRNNAIGTVNSINWTRIVFQVVYYFMVYYRITNSKREAVIVSVPSGNFGNSFAGIVAKFLGLPVRAVIISTNENNVLEEFFKTGKYTVRDANRTLTTDCPSMDISKASNLERLIYEVLSKNSKLLSDAFEHVSWNKPLSILGYISFRSLRTLGISASSSHRIERILIIRYLYESSGIVIDTHTANGIQALLLLGGSHCLRVVLETAQPLKTKELIARTLRTSYLLGSFRIPKYSRLVTCIASHLVRIIKTNST